MAKGRTLEQKAELYAARLVEAQRGMVSYDEAHRRAAELLRKAAQRLEEKIT